MQAFPFPGAVIAALVVLAAVAYFARIRRYYGRMFSEDNFREFHKGLSRAMEVAKGKGPDAVPSPEDGSAFVTGAGLAVGVTFSLDEDETYRLHVSLSQTERPTTHAVSSRFAFFIVAMLGHNKAKLFPYFTESRVHHLVFWFRSDDLEVRDFDGAYSKYQNEYTEIFFLFHEIEGEPFPAAIG
jgi:hypothetical protein